MSDFLKGDQFGQSNFSIKPNQLPTKAPSLDYLTIKKASLVFRAINHKLRQEMIRLIDKRGQATVTEIFVDLRLEQSVASQHLAILRRAGIVLTERDGKYMYYKLNLDRLGMINQIVSDLLK
ncbi:MAG: helix-turn-helix transcriptional regulator [Chitinophagaceae bacterium]|jgi:DNA-binding transcriptional ArsR family regulator|nr:helix-turn-helix transcriptional regulator [Chitinophagaceae bacterium]